MYGIRPSPSHLVIAIHAALQAGGAGQPRARHVRAQRQRGAVGPLLDLPPLQVGQHLRLGRAVRLLAVQRCAGKA